MFERSEFALKILCYAMAAFLVCRLVMVIAHINPLYHVTIPALPTLPSVAAAPVGGSTTNPGGSIKQGTSVAQQAAAKLNTNNQARATNLVYRSTNQVSTATNSVAHLTNSASHVTNTVTQTTNTTAHTSNVIAQSTNPLPNLTNSASPLLPVGRLAMAMPGGPMPGMAKPGPELPPDIQARIDRVIDSEILAPVMRPLPMALLGIAGNDVFLRAPNGQTGLIKAGEELAGVKLLRIGVNRVLVEEQGERKELTIFAGLGGESLLSTQKDSPK